MGEILNKRQIQAKNTYDNIYKVAMSLVERKGFDNVTVEEICNKAGVSVGSFYNYFNSKHDILIEIFKQADEYFINTVASDLNEGDISDKIVKYFSNYARYCTNIDIDLLKQIYSTSNTHFIKKGRYMQVVLSNLLEEGIKYGELQTDMEIEEIVEYFFIALRGVIFDWCLHDGDYDLVEFTANYTRRLFRVL